MITKSTYTLNGEMLERPAAAAKGGMRPMLSGSSYVPGTITG
jgi:hypothetical protein